MDLIAPKKCYSCKKQWHFFCKLCFKKTHHFEEICYICKRYSKNSFVHLKCKNNVFYDRVLVLKHYKNSIISKLIKDSKFYNKKEILKEFSFYMLKKINNEDIEQNIVVSVPSYFLRKLSRWYNSSEVLAKEFSSLTNLFYKNNLIFKVKNTLQQSKLDRKSRLKNLENSFKINPKYKKYIENRHILLIDDVISTGATLNEVSKILKENKALSVTWIIIASD